MIQQIVFNNVICELHYHILIIRIQYFFLIV